MQNSGSSAKKAPVKADIPLQAVCKGFKQELFEGCYKRILKRIKAAKKKATANKDLKGIAGKDMAKTIKTASDAVSLVSKKSIDKSKSIAVDDKKSNAPSAKKDDKSKD